MNEQFSAYQRTTFLSICEWIAKPLAQHWFLFGAVPYPLLAPMAIAETCLAAREIRGNLRGDNVRAEDGVVVGRALGLVCVTALIVFTGRT